MKKLAYSLLLGVILLSLVGCSNSDKKMKLENLKTQLNPF